MVARRFYTPREIAGLLGVSPTTVMKLIHEDRLAAVRVSERIYRIPITAFERFMSGATSRTIEVKHRRVGRVERLGRDERLPRRRASAASR